MNSQIARPRGLRRRFSQGWIGGDGGGMPREVLAALGVLIAIDELDHADRGGIAVAIAGLQHARITAITILVAWSDDLEELLHHRDVADLPDRLPPCVQVAALAKRDQLLNDRPKIFRLRQRGHDL